MRRLKWSIAGGMAALVIAGGGSACGSSGGPSPSAATPSSGGSPSVSAPPQASAPPSPSSAPAPQPGSASGVTVSVGGSGYAVGDTVKVTVHNGRRSPIYAEDFQTACTIVTLQSAKGGSWTDITGCGMGRPTRTVKIDPGGTKTVLLDPHGFQLAEGSGELGFGAGTYRIKFGYRLGAEPLGTSSTTAYSAAFTIR